VRFGSYQTQGFQDEMFDADGIVRPEARLLLDTIESLEDGQLIRCQQAAERLLLQMGITFNVYGDSAGAERIFRLARGGPVEDRGYRLRLAGDCQAHLLC